MGKSAPKLSNPFEGGNLLGNINRNLTEMADPLGIDPVGRYLHNVATQFVDPGYTEETMNDLVGKAPGEVKKMKPQGPEEKARLSAFKAAKDELRRKRAYTTLFTGGQGLLENPGTSSTSLMGS